MWQQITDKNYWNKLVSSQPHARFLQSWDWGEFQQSLGRKVLRFSSGNMFAHAVKMPLPGGWAYWYIPHGPILAGAADDLQTAFAELQKTLGKHGALFLRVDPTVAFNPQVKIKAISATQPQCTLVLDLSRQEEEILSKMHHKTRYNINLARKKGVVVGPGSVDDFITLNRATTKRDKFASHPDWYYKKMSEVLANGDCRLKIWQASFEEKIIASALVMYFGDTATYAHGASGNEFRNVKAAHLLHWEIIKDAQRQGFRYYDWRGVNPLDERHLAYKKSWPGVTRFKTGFGGEVICYPDSFDLIYRSNWYRLYRLLRSIRGVF